MKSSLHEVLWYLMEGVQMRNSLLRFNEEVVRFEFAGIPMVGNLANGYAIGLTEEGACLCDRLFEEEVPEEEVASVDTHLLEHLLLAGFLGETPPKQGLQSAYLHVTNRCNLECVGCYSLDDQRNLAPDASLDSLKHALNELTRGGVKSLVISGGEPFLREDIVELVVYAKLECKMAHISLLSNGTCIDAIRVKQMASYVDRISISFDGCSNQSTAYIRGKQRFTKLVDAVKMIQEQGVASHIIATIHAKNIDDLASYDELARRLGVSLSLSLLSCPAASTGLGALAPQENELKQLGNELLKLGGDGQVAVLDSPLGVSITVKRSCGLGQRTISVAADGVVYPCHILHTPELSMGNLFDDCIEEMIHGNLAMSLGELDVTEFKECKACDYRWICGGGCRGRSFSSAGDLISKDGYCSMITEFYDGLGSRLRSLRVK